MSETATRPKGHPRDTSTTVFVPVVSVHPDRKPAPLLAEEDLE